MLPQDNISIWPFQKLYNNFKKSFINLECLHKLLYSGGIGRRILSSRSTRTTQQVQGKPIPPETILLNTHTCAYTNAQRKEIFVLKSVNQQSINVSSMWLAT